MDDLRKKAIECRRELFKDFPLRQVDKVSRYADLITNCVALANREEDAQVRKFINDFAFRISELLQNELKKESE